VQSEPQSIPEGDDVTVPVPKPALLTERPYMVGAAAWFTVNVWPAMAIVPVRAPAAFAATE